MFGYDSPELHPLKSTPNREKEVAAAVRAKEFLESLILNKIVTAEFYKYDKYGRPLCNIFIPDPDSSKIVCKNLLCVNTLMIRKGYGQEYMGGKKKGFTYE